MPAVTYAASSKGADAMPAADGNQRPSPALDGLAHLVAAPLEGDTERPQAGTVSNSDRISLLKWIAAGTLVAVPLVVLLDGARRRFWHRRS